MDNGLRAHYKPRWIESWPSIEVQQLPSSNGVRNNWGRAHTRPGLEPLSRGALDVFEARREVDGGILSEGGIEPSDPIAGTKIRTTTLWHFWRAPPWPLVDSYRMEHELPLEFPANSSPEIIETRPARIVRRSPPLLLS
jgi:hypothetical protein